MMQQGYKKLRMQPGKWWPTCSSSVPASPFTYICPATFPIKDYLGKTSPVTAACSSRSHYQVAGGAESMPKAVPWVTGIRTRSHRKRKPLPKPLPIPSSSCQGSAPFITPQRLPPHHGVSKSLSIFKQQTDVPFPKTVTREQHSKNINGTLKSPNGFSSSIPPAL